MIDAINDMSETQFLVGPDGDWEDLDIDDIFAKSFHGVIEDWSVDTTGEPGRGKELEGRLIAEPIDPVDFVTSDAFTIVTLPDPATGVAALCQGKLVGLYAGSDLAVHEDYRCRGIGTHLVIERFTRFGDLPTWNLDTPAYSRAGLRAHQRAFTLLSTHRPQLGESDQGPTP